MKTIMVVINILTRTGNRETYYKTLKDSIDLQSYENIRHIKSNDNANCSYLKDEEDVICVSPNRKAGRAFYNLYLNDLGKQPKEGWVIILDDDSKLIDATFIEKLAKICDKSSENEVIIYKARIYKDRILPKDDNFRNNIFQNGDIDMACFCVHYSVFSNFKFKADVCGDFHFLNLIKNSNKYKFKYVDLPIGIWANYDGAKGGR
jgi:hypothetical protein